jgi:tRNA-(ms[2]io[6]A)-hydroxylase
MMMQIFDLLLEPTPHSWVEKALQDQETLLIDHAHCEKKAASTALSLMYRYPEKYQLLQKMSRLAREELRHFERVLSLMQTREIQFKSIAPARYAKGLNQHARTFELLVLLLKRALVNAFPH